MSVDVFMGSIIATGTPERSPWLVHLGRIALLIIYVLQVCLFVSFLIVHLDNSAYVAWFLLFVPAFISFWHFLDLAKSYAEDDKHIRYVWITWGMYIVPYVATVGLIFSTVAHKLNKDDILGINALISTLCLTPVLLILLLQLTISPSYQKPILLLSIFAALNIFDGIKLLEIFLMQNDANFDLNKSTEITIVVFACICFILSPFGLVRNKFVADGVTRTRKETSIILVQLEIIGINFPFLLLRAILWRKYETAIFMVKNIVALVIGVIEFLMLKGMCKCGEYPTPAET